MSSIQHHFIKTGLFQKAGAYVLVDGQFGSTGKGLVASFLAEHMGEYVGLVSSNAGPNSGHTSFFGDEKIVLCQLPSFAVTQLKMGHRPLIQMNAGAIIEPKRFNEEIEQYVPKTAFREFGVWVHPNAAIVHEGTKEAEAGMHERIGSTGKGTGAALAAKVMRDPSAVAKSNTDELNALVGVVSAHRRVTFLEVSQGFSLSLNAAPFYPYCTSRDCTVAQAISDAGMHPTDFRQSIMVVRTYPIRVAGNSGPHYHDQVETTWGDLGVEPEITTVTKKVRRVFTFSREQFAQALIANRPAHVMVNFMNYLPGGFSEHDIWLRENILSVYRDVMACDPATVLLGYGPRNSDVQQWSFK